MSDPRRLEFDNLVIEIAKTKAGIQIDVADFEYLSVRFTLDNEEAQDFIGALVDVGGWRRKASAK